MLNKKDIDYFNEGKIEIEKFWKRLGVEINFKEKTVLDFGCGHGAFCIDLAKKNAKRVIGIDLETSLLEFAKKNLEINYSNLKNILEFKEVDILDSSFDEKVDIIVSKDTFEHALNLDKILDKFYEILNPGGKVYLGFGPLYNFFNGDHGRTNLKLPWLHAVLPEKYILKNFNRTNLNKITKIEDLGLNKYSFKQYKKLFYKSKFKVTYFETNKSDHPIFMVINLFKNIPILEEYLTNNIYCTLEK
jgi:2-polyprenyl-3-methyl-5-hydroxy-6-metoxy-1,4-benzoquinol methylase